MTELTLSLEELYFLGKQMNAMYIDYRYVAAMDDIHQRAALIEQQCRDDLAKRGIFEENLWGDIELCKEVSDFLHPLFFGTFESSYDIIKHGPTDLIGTVIFHREDAEFRASVIDGGNVKIWKVGTDDIDEMIYRILPYKYDEAKEPGEDFSLPKERDRMIYLKNVTAGGPAAVLQYFESGGYLFEEAGENGIRPVLAEEFCRVAAGVLKGV